MTYPLGYPLASSAKCENARNGAGSLRPSPTKDLRSSSRLSPRKLASIRERLSARDLAILTAVARFRVLSGEQLQRLYWPEGSPETRARLARHGLARLSHLGVITPLARRVGGVRSGSKGLTFAVGLSGQRLLASEASTRRARHPYTPGERYLAHTLAVAQIYVELVEAERRDACDLLAFHAEPACWRAYLGPFAARLMLKPDAYIKLGVGEYEFSWLLEMDMATEALTTIERKARRHLDYHRSGDARRNHGVSPRVVWIVPDQKRLDAIQIALGRLPAEAGRLFAVATSADAVTFLTEGPRV
ncbi:MAG: replication-relaxation family protein [Solirubrobacteraceae bacterium]